MSIYLKVKQEKDRLEKEIQKSTKLVDKAPPGRLVCKKDRGHFRFYQCLPGNIHKYLSKKKQQLIFALGRKALEIRRLQDLTNEKKAVEAYLRVMESKKPRAIELLKSPPYQYLFSHLDPDQKIHEWERAQFQSNPLNPESLTIKTSHGEYVRSKSEAIIAEGLFKGSLGYRYECALQLGNSIVYPDFTIIHPVTGKIYIWEHLGMMDNPGYLSKTMAKIAAYIQNKYLPTDNLILTWESAEVPLSPAYVEAVIDYYFLS